VSPISAPAQEDLKLVVYLSSLLSEIPENVRVGSGAWKGSKATSGEAVHHKAQSILREHFS